MTITTVINTFLEQYDLRTPGIKIGVAVSGGEDSSVLMHGILSLAQRYGIIVAGVHVNYNLRGEASVGDREFVRMLCEKHRVPAYIKETVYDPHAGNIQSWARRIRYDFFNALHDEGMIDYIMLAHHADDQAETVLYRLITGSGVTGVSAMRPKRGIVLRPLLTVTKTEIHAWAEAEHITFRTDASNASRKYMRNRIRHDLLAQCTALIPDAQKHIASFAHVLQDHLSLVRKDLSRIYRERCTIEHENVHLSITGWPGVHPPLRELLLHRILMHLRVRPSRARITAIEHIIRSGKPNIITSFAAIQICKEYARIIFVRNPKPTQQYCIIAADDGMYLIPGGTVTVKRVPRNTIAALTGTTIYLDAATVHFPLTIRSRLAGDALRIFPHGGTVSVKKLFIDRKISRMTRTIVPVFEDSLNGIVAIGTGWSTAPQNHTIACGNIVHEKTAVVLCLSFTPTA